MITVAKKVHVNVEVEVEVEELDVGQREELLKELCSVMESDDICVAVESDQTLHSIIENWPNESEYLDACDSLVAQVEPDDWVQSLIRKSDFEGTTNAFVDNLPPGQILDSVFNVHGVHELLPSFVKAMDSHNAEVSHKMVEFALGIIDCFINAKGGGHFSDQHYAEVITVLKSKVGMEAALNAVSDHYSQATKDVIEGGDDNGR